MLLELALFAVLWFFLGFWPALFVWAVFFVVGAFIPRKKTISERLAAPLF